ncbi:hypothetical protein [Leptospira noguchii]|uniref:Uncharacterized protein n=1 Tax=Leptospira noguchii TaxID=28182 RepID=A0AAE9GC15_9LEPT|nr:hypothetical protein [Leptospira noguchii]UOG28936.1 hypothetical protein MAL06_09360 [Leptospira noguchii]UOG55128.1 hypothetical protein MAL03_09240 [Leptospira noguchii]
MERKELNETLFTKALETQHNAFLRVALETKAQRFPKGRVVGGNSVLQRICRNSHRFNIEIQILMGLVMINR